MAAMNRERTLMVSCRAIASGRKQNGSPDGGEPLRTGGAVTAGGVSASGVALQQRFRQWGVVLAHLVGRGRVGAREVVHLRVVLPKERLVVCHGVILAEQSPHLVAVLGAATVPLVLLEVGKFVDQRLVDGELRVAVRAGRLIGVGTDALGQERGHAQMGVTQQGGESRLRGDDLRKERPVAVAHQHVGLLLHAKLPDESDGLARVDGQVGRQYLCLAFKVLLQGLSRSAGSRSEKAVQEKYFPCHVGRYCGAYLTAAAVDAAGGACGYGTRAQTGLLGNERYRAVLEYEAGNAHRAVAFGCLESGRTVAKTEESFEVPHVAADVDDFVAVVAFDLFLHVGAVGTGFHTIDLDHVVVCAVGDVGHRAGL